MRWDVVGIGNAIMDVLVVIDNDDLLKDVGLTRGVTSLTPDEAAWQEHFARVRHLPWTTASGGSCANTLSVLGQLGARAAFHGCVGDDAEGRSYADGLASAGVHGELVTDAALPTGKCLAVISGTDAERTMITLLAASSRHDLLGGFDAYLADARVLHVEGYMLFGEAFDVTLASIQRARAAGATISFDASDPSVVLYAGDRVRALLPLVDIVFLNAEEAHHLTGHDAEKAAPIVADTYGIATVVVKLGAHGSIVRVAGVDHRIHADKVRAVDTTGAGDSYAGGFLYGWLRGWTPAQCGQIASSVAGATVSQVGAVVRDAARLRAMADAVGG
jgi:hypothetical protein